MLRKFFHIFYTFYIFCAFFILPAYAAEKDLTVRNGGFEAEFAEWTHWEGDGAYTEIVPGVSHGGGFSVKTVIEGGGHTSIWQVTDLSALGGIFAPNDKVKVSAWLCCGPDADTFNPDFSLRLEAYDTRGEQYVITQTVSQTKELEKGKWVYIESPYVRMPQNTLKTVISFVDNMRGTLYVDDISMTGKFNKEISYTKKERNGLPIKPLLELEKIQFPSQINDEKISRTINLNPEYLDTVTMFFLHAKGEGKIRITVEIIDYHGYRTTVARSATRDLTEEFQYVPTDLGVILDRSDSLVINIEVTGTAEISLEEDSE